MHQQEDLRQILLAVASSQPITSSSSQMPKETKNMFARLTLHAQAQLQPTSLGTGEVSSK